MLPEALVKIVQALKKVSDVSEDLYEESQRLFWKNENLQGSRLAEEKLLERIELVLGVFCEIDDLMTALDMNLELESVAKNILADAMTYHERNINFALGEGRQSMAIDNLFVDNTGGSQLCGLAQEIEGLPEEHWAK
ncbi:hypothetical protein ACFL16_00430 [Patescibacteria group bacterium]